MATLTERQQEILSRLKDGLGAREIAEELEITRNAVYQQIQALRKRGALEPDFTPTGQPVREMTPGAETLTRLLSDGTNDVENRAGQFALVQMLREVRDECDTISRRISMVIPR